MDADDIDVIAAEQAEGMPPVVAPTNAWLDNITVTKADGRVIDLGRPSSLRYRYRLWRYKKGLI